MEKKYLKSLENNKSPFAEALIFEYLLMSLFFHFLLRFHASTFILNSGHIYCLKTGKDKSKYICE